MGLQKPEKARQEILPQSLQEERGPVNTLTLAQFQTLDSRIVRKRMRVVLSAKAFTAAIGDKHTHILNFKYDGPHVFEMKPTFLLRTFQKTVTPLEHSIGFC